MPRQAGSDASDRAGLEWGRAVGTVVSVPTTFPASLKPRLRGRLHQLAFLVAIPAGVWVIVGAHPAAARTAAVVYACGLIGLYGVSSGYHLLAHSERARYWMRRADHSMIFVFIAASITPFCLVVLHGSLAIAVLIGVWAGAAGGVVLKLMRLEKSPKLGFAMYLLLGWSALVALPQIAHSLTGGELVLLVSGGVLYSGGAIILAGHRPDPVPAVFGYHELWHTFVVAASGCQFLVIRSVLAGSH